MPICIASRDAASTKGEWIDVDADTVALFAPSYRDRHVTVFLDGLLLTGSGDVDSAGHVVRLYHRYGPEFWLHLEGYYAIVVLDHDRETLFACHDRDGAERLFYWLPAWDRREFVLSNDMRTIMRLKATALDEAATTEFFVYGHVVSRRTLVRGVSKLLPLETIQYQRGAWKLDRSAFSRLVDIEVKENTRAREAVRVVYETMSEHVRQLVAQSDAVANLLSGGVDSSFIQCLLLENDCRRSYSAGYTGVGRENDYALKVAGKLGTQHSAVDIPADQLLWAIEDGIASCGMPFVNLGEASQLLLFARFADTVGSQRGTMFGGDLGDLLMGYGMTALVARMLTQAMSLPVGVQDSVSRWLWGRLVPDWADLAGCARRSELDAAQTRKLLRLSPRVQRFSRALECFDDTTLVSEARQVMNASRGSFENRTARVQALVGGGMVRILWTQYQLAKMKGLIMAQPFSNHKLVEYMFTVPNRVKVRYYQPKYLTKRLLSRRLPAWYAFRPKLSNSVAFCGYLAESRRFDSLVEELRDIDNTGYGQHFVDLPGYVDAVLQESRATGVVSGDLVHLLNFHLWYTRFFSQPGVERAGM